MEVIAVIAPLVVKAGVEVGSSSWTETVGIVLTMMRPCAVPPVLTKWMTTSERPSGRALNVTALCELMNCGFMTRPAVAVLVVGVFKSEIAPRGFSTQPQLTFAVLTEDTQVGPRVSVTV